MGFISYSLLVPLFFFVGSLLLLSYGRRLGSRYTEREGAESARGLTTVEGSMFALIGLLLAFTISGALSRFDERRQLVVREATAISAAYDNLGLFEGEVARDLQGQLKDYLGARVEFYRTPREYSFLTGKEELPREQLDRVFELKTKLWAAAAAACAQANHPPACGQALPALVGVFEVALVRAGASEKHPPRIVYAMLFGLALGGSLLAGFGMGAANAHSSIHRLLFASTLTVVLYVVTDMEYPRLGVIRVDSFDHFLTDIHDRMQ